MKNIIIILAFFTLISCGEKEKLAEEIVLEEDNNSLKLTDEQLKTFDLSTVVLQERTITKSLKLNGELNVPPQNLVSISSVLGGYVKSTKLLPGMFVRKGEVLAVIEDNQFIQLQQDYLTTKTQLINAEAEYHRQKDLNLNKASSDKVYLQAEADYKTLLISKSSLEQKLKLITIDPNKVSVANIRESISIYAPFNGYVSDIFVNIGKYISPNDVLLELINLSDLYLKLKVFEQDLDAIEIGQSVTVYTNSKPDKKYEAELIQIGKSFSADRAVAVYAKLKEVDPKLIPGMYMNAEIIVPENKTRALPEESVVSFEGKDYVFEVLDSNTFEMIEVQVGNSGNGWLEIKNATTLQDKKIAEKGAYALLMALKNKGEE